ncbi:mitochondrial escape protein 2 [Gonapodya sp. JEL0774]|nr:mitochondrial escape protein 2 [Gonapodya sp. JEL0774]
MISRPLSSSSPILLKRDRDELEGGHDVAVSPEIETAKSVPGSQGEDNEPPFSDSSTSGAQGTQVLMQHAALWYSNVVPVRLGWWDLRYLFVSIKPTALASYAESHLLPAKFPQPFLVRSVVASPKEGGMVLYYSYGGDVKEARGLVRKWVKEAHVRRWYEFWQEVGVVEVKGRPFVEDMTNRYPNNCLRVEFLRGPDLSVEQLFNEFRQYGKIVDVQGPFPPQLAGSPRYALVKFRSLRAATAAKNGSHGQELAGTMLGTGYERRQKVVSIILEWINKHTRSIVLAITALAAFVSYALLDPLREFFISNKITHRYSLSRIVPLFSHADHNLSALDSSDSMDLAKVADRLRNSLEGPPDTFVVVTGPEGSGKREVIHAVGEQTKYRLVIDAESLLTQSTDERVLANLSAQTGYWPYFSGFARVAGLADAGITATTGQKANLSSTPHEDAKSVLEKVAAALAAVVEEQSLKSGGLEGKHQGVHVPKTPSRQAPAKQGSKVVSRDRNEEDESEIPENTIDYPVVIITGFLKNTHGRAQKNAWMAELLADWSARLVQNDLAHVVFETGNAGAIKMLGKFLPSRPFEHITLTDAAVDRATSFVQARLSGEEDLINKRGDNLSQETLAQYLVGLGGRMTDLNLWVQKVKAGLSFKDAFDELVSKSISEIRKSGFGDNPSERAKLPWSQEQFWQIVVALTDKEEVSFDALKYGLVFRGDESPLLAMEEEELISISLQNGRPYAVRAARPVYRTAFKHIVDTDVRYTAAMNSQVSKFVIGKESDKIRVLEMELSQLAGILGDTVGMKASLSREARQALEQRVNFLASEIASSTAKIATFSVTDKLWKKKMLDSIKEDKEYSESIWT